jgi:predicted RNase H-like nuclease (RuvC/YqgF family)
MPQPQMGLTFEQVWAALMEDREARRISQEKTDEQQRKTDEAINKMVEERRKTDEEHRKTEEAINKMSERVDRLTANVDRVTANVGGLNRSMGELIETLIAARLWEKFDAYPYNLKRAYQRVPLFDENNRILTDIDILLSNGEYCMAVEVKAQLSKHGDVDHHLKRMELILKYPPAECKGKKLLGAMAGGSVDADVLAYAQSAGFFVLELTGESVRLADAPDGFTPRQW